MKPLGEVMAALVARRRETRGEQEPLEPDPPFLDIPGVDRNCDRCKGLGKLRYDEPVGSARFGQAVDCPACLGPYMERVRFERMWKQIPDERRTQRLEGFPGGPEYRMLVEGWVEQADDEPCETPWLHLWGPRGTGKTGLQAGAAIALMEKRGRTLVWATVPTLLDRLRQAYAPDAEDSYDDVMDSILNADVVVIDDLGTQRSTPWAEEKLFQIFDGRYNERKLTIISSNYDPNRLAATSDTLGRIIDRIFDLALIVHVKEPNIREQHALERARRMRNGGAS